MKQRHGVLLSIFCILFGAHFAQAGYPTTKIIGFSQAGYSHNASKTSFALGQFVLHANSYLSDHVSGFGEITWTAKKATTGSKADYFKPAIERVVIRWDLSEAFKLSIGKYHTGISWWNGYFHHGRWLQTTVDRPSMLGFGGSLMPIHFVGLLSEGQFFLSPSFRLKYSLGFGNGRSQALGTAGEAGDVNGNKALNGSISVAPSSNFETGVGFYFDQLKLNSSTGVSGTPTNERIFSFFLAYTEEDPEFLAEVAHITHDSGTARSSIAYYAQLAYRLPFLKEQLKPYFRFDGSSIDQDDAILNTKLKSKATHSLLTFGLRWDFTTFAAFKNEIQLSEGTDVSYKMQVAATF